MGGGLDLDDWRVWLQDKERDLLRGMSLSDLDWLQAWLDCRDMNAQDRALLRSRNHAWVLLIGEPKNRAKPLNFRERTLAGISAIGMIHDGQTFLKTLKEHELIVDLSPYLLLEVAVALRKAFTEDRRTREPLFSYVRARLSESRVH